MDAKEQLSGTFLIKQLAKGPKGRRALTVTEAKQMVQGYAQGELSELHFGTALMVMRARGETAEEMAGMALGLQSLIPPSWQQLAPDLDWPVYAGKRQQLPWLLLAAKCLAQTGLRIVLHGDAKTNAHRCHVADCLAEIGIEQAQSFAHAQRVLDKQGIIYVDLPSLMPMLDQHRQLQQHLGLRSGLQMALRACNPFAAPMAIRSYFHPPQLAHHQQIAALMAEQTEFACDYLLFKGQHGESEVNPKVSQDLTFVAERGMSETVKKTMTLPSCSLSPLIGELTLVQLQAEQDPQQLTRLWQTDLRQQANVSMTDLEPATELISQWQQQSVLYTLAACQWLLACRQRQKTPDLFPFELSPADLLARAKQLWHQRLFADPSLSYSKGLEKVTCSKIATEV